MRHPERESIRDALHDDGFEVASITPVSGGDIADSYRLSDRRGRLLFVKCGAGALLAAERTGLATLRSAAHRLVIPEPLSVLALDSDRSALVLEWLETASPGETHWEQLGRGVAELHRHTSETYGFEEDNYIGRLPQVNTHSASWCEFFVTRRLEPQVRMAKKGGRWMSGWGRRYARVEARVEELLPDRPIASLVHGDLWGGNALATVGGPAVIDPAVYYGHREVDLAMSELFGGFSSRFYSAYREDWPLDPGYENRRDLYNLYHLLNHLNHFGGGYAGSVDRILRRYGT